MSVLGGNGKEEWTLVVDGSGAWTADAAFHWRSGFLMNALHGKTGDWDGIAGSYLD